MFTYIPSYTQTLLWYLKPLREIPVAVKVRGYAYHYADEEI